MAKPVLFNNRIVDIVSTWFDDGQRLSPFELSEPMLATEGDDSRFRGHTITFLPYSLDPTSVMKVRQRIIDLAFEELKSPDRRRAGAAVRLLKSALCFPTGRFGREVGPAANGTGGRPGSSTRSSGSALLLRPGLPIPLSWSAFATPCTGVGIMRKDRPGRRQRKPWGRFPTESSPCWALVIHDGWVHLFATVVTTTK